MKSLEDQVKNIKSIFNDIKNAINNKGVSVSDCDSPEVYANKINEISGSSENVNILAYKSAESKPDKPVGGSGDGNNINYPDGGSDGSGLTGDVYMSYAIFGINTTLRDGADPIKITGPAGMPGKDGAQGPKGDPGDIKVLERYVPIYITSEGNPGMPSGGYGDTESDEITVPDGWSLSSELSYPIWNSGGKFLATNPNAPVGSSPIRISGIDGKTGEDGDTEEFIYKQTKTSLTTPNKPESKNETGYVPSGWTDHPGGITEDNTCEWVCVRKKISGEGKEGSDPVIGAKWGVNGQDGDGVEYIYQVTSSGTTPTNPTPEDYKTNSNYQEDEYLPIGGVDNPSSVSVTEQYCGVCSRKGSSGNGGKFSNPALWAKYGETGESGVSIREMYTVTDSSSDVPIVVKDEINPGSIGSLLIPSSENKIIWAINAYFKYDGTLITEDEYPNLVYGWSDPYIKSGKSGKDGKDGTPANYVTTVFCESISQPLTPEVNVSPDEPGTSLNTSGETVIWKVLPDNTSQSWGRCSGTVNGVTGLVEKGGSVVKDSGRDGAAKEGKREEFRYAISDTILDAPEINKESRVPDGWILTSDSEYENLVNQVKDGKYLFWTKATIDSDDNLVGTGSEPAPLSGPKGDVGPIGPAGSVGPQGVSGIPGVSFIMQYAIGDKNKYVDTGYDDVSNCIPTEENPYIGVKQGKKTYSDNANYTISYDAPFRLQGINGLNGTNGKDGAPGKDGVDGKDGADGSKGETGQIIYPAGIYNKYKTYTTTSYNAPYVFDTLTGKFYVLNDSSGAAGQDTPISQSSSGVAFDMMDAIFAKVAVVPNALIGSAVYNGDYMFSQQGSGTSDNYADFKSSEAAKGEETGSVNSLTTFKPNILINFKTGSAYFGKGAFTFNADGRSEFRINYPDTNQTAMLLSSENPGIVQYGPNGQVQKKEVWDYDSDGNPISIITNYYDKSGTLVATVDAMGKYTQVSGGWAYITKQFPLSVLPTLSNGKEIISNPTIFGGFNVADFPTKNLYYYERSTSSGEYDGLKYETIKNVTDPEPTSIDGTYTGLTYYSRNATSTTVKCVTLESATEDMLTFKNAIKFSYSGKGSSSIISNEVVEVLSSSYVSEDSFDSSTYSKILKQPVAQLISINYVFDKYTNGYLYEGNQKQTMYIAKIYTPRDISSKSDLRTMETNCEYYFMINQSDVPNAMLNYTNSVSTSNLGGFVNFEYE